MKWGTRWLSWFRQFAACLKVAVSIPDVVAVIFHSLIPSGRNMALAETCTRNICWRLGRGGWALKAICT